MSDDEFEVEEILQSRHRKKQTEYLVRWKGYGSENDSWEPAENLSNCPEILERFINKSTPARKSRTSRQSLEEFKRSNSRSRSRSLNRNTVKKLQKSIKPVEVMINGMIQEKHSAVAELVKSSLDISPRSFREAAGRYPTIKEIRSHAAQRSYQKFTTIDDTVSDDEIDNTSSDLKHSKRLNFGKYIFVFSLIVCFFGIVWAGLLLILSFPALNGNPNSDKSD